MKIAFSTLGCKLNYAETSTYERGFVAAGWEVVPWTAQADVYLINTCAVTETAEKKSRNLIRRAHKTSPEARIVVTGCYAQLRRDQLLSIDGVWKVFGADEKKQIVTDTLGGHDVWEGSRSDGSPITTPRMESVAFGAYSTGERTRSFLKVQDGCDNFCAYCTVPYARGRSRSIPVCECVKMARDIAAKGVKEVVLTGVNTGDFGRTSRETFLDLLKALNEVEGIERYRISSIEPNLITPEIVDWIASGTKFQRHFHIPLQSGSDEVLRLMHRHYDRQLFADKIQRIKETMPQAFIGVDVMVGCRGETPECFEETYSFLEALDVTQLHVFPYSERPGTAALKIPYVVADKEKRQRSQRLLALSDRKTQQFYERHIGQQAEVLFEKATRGRAMHGFTRNYIRVELSAADARAEYDNQLMTGTLGAFNHDQSALLWIK